MRALATAAAPTLNAHPRRASLCACGRYRIAAKGAWYIGSTPGSETAAAVVYDNATLPEGIKTPTWRYYDSGKWVVVRAGVWAPTPAKGDGAGV